MSANLAPTWDLMINGSKLLPDGMKALVTGLVVDSTVDGADQLTITAHAYSPTAAPGDRWAMAGSSLLAAGNTVVVWVGYHDGADLPTALQRFRLVAEDIAYQGGIPVVTIRGYSAEARLGEYTEARAWEGPIADSDIAQEIAEDHGLEFEIEATDSRDQDRHKPRGESDLVFLRKLATANGYGPPIVRYDADADVDRLYFAPTEADTSAALTFIHDPTEAEAELGSGSCLTFRASLDLHGVPTTIVVGGFDPDLQTPIVVTMKVADAGQEPMILVGDDAAPYELHGAGEYQAKALADSDDPRDELIESMALPSTIVDVEGAADWATRWVKLRAAAFLTGRATILGNPLVWAGQVHDFQGLAPHHVGLWEVMAAKHVLNGQGYTVALDLARVLEDANEPEEA